MSIAYIQLTFNSLVEQLDKIFSSGMSQPAPEIRTQIEAIKRFYKNTMHYALETLDQDLGLATAAQYKYLYYMFSDLKSGEITKEDALKFVKEITDKRLDRITSNNIFNACQLLFCTALGIGAFAACIMFGIPLATTLGPLLGIAIITALIGAINACCNFESTTPIYEEEERYKDTISFFKPEKILIEKAKQTEADSEMLFCGT